MSLGLQGLFDRIEDGLQLFVAVDEALASNLGVHELVTVKKKQENRSDLRRDKALEEREHRTTLPSTVTSNLEVAVGVASPATVILSPNSDLSSAANAL